MGAGGPTMLQKYSYVQQICKGEYSKIVRAQCKDKQYAIKMIKIGNFETVRLARQQAKMIQRLKCQNLIKIYETFVWRDYFCLVMEECQEFFWKKLQYQARIKVCFDLIKAVYLLHQNQIVHGEIKRENILFKNSTVKLAGFGLASQIIMRRPTIKNKTVYCYKAPQQLGSGKSKQIDCWALGLLLLQIWTQTRVNYFRPNCKYPADLPDFPSETDLKKVQISTLKQAIKMLLQRDPTKKLTISQVVDSLRTKNISSSLYKGISQSLKFTDQNIEQLKIAKLQFPKPKQNSKHQSSFEIQQFAKQLQRFKSLRKLTISYSKAFIRRPHKDNSHYKRLVTVLNGLSNLQQISIVLNQKQDEKENERENQNMNIHKIEVNEHSWLKDLRPSLKVYYSD